MRLCTVSRRYRLTVFMGMKYFGAGRELSYPSFLMAWIVKSPNLMSYTCSLNAYNKYDEQLMYNFTLYVTDVFTHLQNIYLKIMIIMED